MNHKHCKGQATPEYALVIPLIVAVVALALVGVIAADGTGNVPAKPIPTPVPAAATSGTISLAPPLTFEVDSIAWMDGPAFPAAEANLGAPALSVVWVDPQSWSDRFGFVFSSDALSMVVPDPSATIDNVVLDSAIPTHENELFQLTATLTAASATRMNVAWTLSAVGGPGLPGAAVVVVANGVVGGVPTIGQLDAEPQTFEDDNAPWSWTLTWAGAH